jgi:RNA polymerase sigma-70 factor (ECF subfamily)
MADEPAGTDDPLVAGFEEAFRAGYEPLVRALTLAAGDREVAADCVADAYERAYARWGRISRYDEPVAWVRRVAINRLRDHFRRAGRGRRALDRLDPPAGEAPAEPAALDLGAALGALPPQQRIAAALFYVDDLPVADIAAAMKISAGAVKYHLHAAREALRTLVGDAVNEHER